ncbi:MAG: glutamine--tRNA ligase/YqeY domain fusion protein [Acidimicrobiaceae bacterium]|nr:glutamine--tRNA ligase/YqeY domain fusion protein [Acidimicrobiaceae bacterium]
MAGTRDETGGAHRPLDFIREQVRADNAAGTYAGRVQTRFPPEPNGFLHIGHAKAVCLNFEVAAENGGACRLRFDDTNPEGEDAAYAEAIADDIAWLGFEPDGRAVHASDYFEHLYQWAEHLVCEGLAYVDDQDAETISATRGDFSTPGTESPCRDRSVEENLSLLRDMRAGRFGNGEKVLRAKINMAHPNMLMRDPVMYRIRHTAHFRTGDAWCIYPTYDWAHGQSDAIEGVTHSLCSLEFDAHRQLYDWYLEHLPLPGDRPRQYEFARLNLTHTVMSKRKLITLVTDGLVDGWDDPRLPTLRGLRRRGYPPEAIREFCAHIGVARVNGVHEIELLESFVRTHLNRTAQRRMAVLRPLEVFITNWPRWDRPVEHRSAVNNPEDPLAGNRLVPFTERLWIERDDFMLDPPRKFYRLAPGREVRLRAGYFLRCNDVETDSDGKVVRLWCTYDPDTGDGQAPDGRKVRATIHWVAADHAVDATVALYDRLFTDPVPGADGRDPLESYNPDSWELIADAKLEPELAKTAPGEVVQFERLGYFAHDSGTPMLFHRTVGLRDEWANIQKRRQQGS